MTLIRQDSPALASLAQDFAWGRKFIVWIGSGLSIPAGLPSWKQLRTRLETRLAAAAPRKMPTLEPDERAELISHIRRLPDPWEAFEALRSRLGAAEYRQVIRLALDDSMIPRPPTTLETIWSSPNVDGMISLNVDNLASRAFAEVNGGRRELARATGVSLNLGLRYLSSYQPFLVQLHGRIDDEDTWIFTKSDLTALFEQPQYKAFVRSALSARRVLFVGCSPDDIAVAKHFDEISSITRNMPEHYWFVPSHEVDAARELDIGFMGINIVEYDVDISESTARQNEQHGRGLFELFEYLESYQYIEPEPEPVNPMAGPVGARLPPLRVQSLSPEQARNLLSRYATAILEGPPAERSAEYQRFVEDYGPAIAVASYVPRVGRGQLFGHEIVGTVGEGAFSRVLKAIAPDGTTVRAIKLVRNEVRDDPVMLRSFRRGVRSMQILSEKGVDGMVAYDQAYEIPPCVIMPFVDGDNLEELGRRASFSFLDEGLPVLARVAEIVYSAHDLPERVLHRDLRPSNMMIKNSIEPIHERVVVLDFDLSWHEGADTDSPISPNMTTVLGYLAPEQIANDLSVSARHTKVDAFGLCMTVYYLLQKQHPDFRLRGTPEWRDVRDSLGRNVAHSVRWKSLFPRIRRLIDYGTELDQANRLDFESVLRELKLAELLRSRALTEICPVDAEFVPLEAVAEEVFATGISSDRYTWRKEQDGGSYYGGLGVRIEIEVSEHKGERGLRLSAEKQFDGTQSFATVRKYWRERQRDVTGIMAKAGWEGGSTQSASNQEISLTFFAPESTVWSAAPKLSQAIAEAWRRLNMN